MDIFEFTDRLSHTLEARGISPTECDEAINRIKKKLSITDVENATDSDIKEAADICVEYLNAKAKSKPQPITETGSFAKVESATKAEPTAETEDTKNDQLSENEEVIKNKEYNGNESSDTTDSDEIALPDYKADGFGAKGVLKIILFTALSSPLWVLSAAIFFAPFILLFAIETALTAVFIGLLAGGTAAGTGASLTGIVYGVVKIFTIPSVGLYEIGFGIILVGITLIFAVLTYNGAVRLMPFVFKKTGRLLALAFSKVKPFIIGYARRCAGK